MASSIAIERYRKREKMLFAQNSEGTIPGTNNGMEIFFRKMRRNVRYRNIVFGNDDIRSVFGKYRIPFRKDGYTKKRIREPVGNGTVMLLNDSVNSDPYSEEMFDKCSEIYKNNRNNG